MSKSELTKMQISQQAEEVVERLLRDYDEEVVGAIRQLLAERVQKPFGRRPEADWPALLEMARIISTDKTDSAREAARMVAHQVEGSSEEAITDRLRRKFGDNREQLMAEVASDAEEENGASDQRASIFERAFEEDVEVWDL